MSGPPVSSGQRLPISVITGLLTTALVAVAATVYGLGTAAWPIGAVAGLAMGIYVWNDLPRRAPAKEKAAGPSRATPSAPSPTRRDTSPMVLDPELNDLLYRLWVADAEEFDDDLFKAFIYGLMVGIWLPAEDTPAAILLATAMEAATGEPLPKEAARRFLKATVDGRTLDDAIRAGLGDPRTLLSDPASEMLAARTGRPARPGGIQVMTAIRFGMTLPGLDAPTTIQAVRRYNRPDFLAADAAAIREVLGEGIDLDAMIPPRPA